MTLIEVKHHFNIPIDKVFSTFESADSAQNFMFRTENGKLIEANLDPESGGTFLFSEKRADTNVSHFGTFVEFEKNQKISFVFSTQKDSDQTDYVEIFFQNSHLGCDVSIQHELKAESAAKKQIITQGWSSLLNRLETYLANQNLNQTTMITKDSLGQILTEGDSVKTIKDLKVKGSSMVIKRGTIVKKIHLISGNDEEVDCKVDGVALSLETQWLTKV